MQFTTSDFCVTIPVDGDDDTIVDEQDGVNFTSCFGIEPGHARACSRQA